MAHVLKQPRAFDRRRPKKIFWNSHFRFKFPTPPRQSQIPHPRDGLSDQIPDSPGKVNIQMPGVCPGGGGGMLMFRIDRRIICLYCYLLFGILLVWQTDKGLKPKSFLLTFFF